jgi:hypothetical protein
MKVLVNTHTHTHISNIILNIHSRFRAKHKLKRKIKNTLHSFSPSAIMHHFENTSFFLVIQVCFYLKLVLYRIARKIKKKKKTSLFFY